MMLTADRDTHLEERGQRCSTTLWPISSSYLAGLRSRTSYTPKMAATASIYADVVSDRSFGSVTHLGEGDFVNGVGAKTILKFGMCKASRHRSVNKPQPQNFSYLVRKVSIRSMHSPSQTPKKLRVYPKRHSYYTHDVRCTLNSPSHKTITHHGPPCSA